jgi:hypothetical protein
MLCNKQQHSNIWTILGTPKQNFHSGDAKLERAIDMENLYKELLAYLPKMKAGLSYHLSVRLPVCI